MENLKPICNISEEFPTLSDDTVVGNFTWGLLKDLEMTENYTTQVWFSELDEKGKYIIKKLDEAQKK